MITPLPYPNHVAKTEPEVFIIESLSVTDEIHERYEGKALRESLRLIGLKPGYCYVRNSRELSEAIEMFRHSGYRWLHFSAHADVDSVCTTLEKIPNSDFADICKGKLKNRRLFFSACEVGSGGLSTLIQGVNKGMYSIASPLDSIQFGVACAFWTAFYTRVLDENPLSMESYVLVPALKNLCRFFNIRVCWSFYNPKADKWKDVRIDP